MGPPVGDTFAVTLLCINTVTRVVGRAMNYCELWVDKGPDTMEPNTQLKCTKTFLFEISRENPFLLQSY